ncbi:hypothetical protein ES703_39043 [subsurface metagenome]
MDRRHMLTRTPTVSDAHEYLEITRDFVDPRDAIREGISNALDWGATEVRVTVTEDRTRPGEELTMEIADNGIGLDERRLEAFFDLGRSTASEIDQPDLGGVWKIGYKGHGTKTFFNSRQIDVFSNSSECTVYAIMDSPLQKLMSDQVPPYDYAIEPRSNEETGTTVKIYDYNTSQNKRDFAHNVLKDYILWFTRFGSAEREFDISVNSDKILFLQGLGCDTAERIEFGHRFASENCDIERLIENRPGGWTRIFAKRWIFNHHPVRDNPGKFIDLVFYIEGDEAKRSYNPMIRVRGRTPEYGMYKVEDRYGLWVCKDHIPVKRYNEWLGLGKRLETKYHAFVNCQDFRLTANRGDIANTPPDLLNAISNTVKQLFEEDILGCREYQEYEEAAELEEQYQTAEQERKDYDRRRNRARTKRVCDFRGVNLLEPGVEMGVIALFNIICSLEPSLFPFRVIDYDTKRGYDALVAQSMPRDLSRESVYFVEFKYMLTSDFNHSFDHLTAVVCWDSAIGEDSEVTDIKNSRRRLRITPPENESEYTKYMLVSPRERHNIEVFVLKDYLREKLGIEFRPRTVSQ